MLVCLGHVIKIELELMEAPDDMIVGSTPFKLDVTGEINSTYPDGEFKTQETNPRYLYIIRKSHLIRDLLRYFKLRNCRRSKRQAYISLNFTVGKSTFSRFTELARLNKRMWPYTWMCRQVRIYCTENPSYWSIFYFFLTLDVRVLFRVIIYQTLMRTVLVSC